MPSSTSDFNRLPALVAIAIGIAIWFIPTPEGVSAQGWLMLAIFVATIAAIIGKAMPIGAISIVAITVVAVSGVTSDNPGTSMRNALGSFSNSLIWLIAIAIMISQDRKSTRLNSSHVRISY